jgi:uncharacterized protein YeaO (DUF488 family)
MRVKLMIKLKRVYEEPSKEDGLRILVEWLRPRGLTKERAAVDLWLKDVAQVQNSEHGLAMTRQSGSISVGVIGLNLRQSKI